MNSVTFVRFEEYIVNNDQIFHNFCFCFFCFLLFFLVYSLYIMIFC